MAVSTAALLTEAGGGGIDCGIADGDGGGEAPSVPCRTSRLGDSDINSEKYGSCRSG